MVDVAWASSKLKRHCLTKLMMTKLVPILAKNGISNGSSLNSKAVELAANLLKNGQVIALPTDTLYGLAAMAQNQDAVDKLYIVKGRSATKPIAICVSEVADIFMWSKVTVPRAMLDDLLPGPVTVVFERSKILNENLNPNISSIGLRIPNNNFIQAVAKLCNSPIALTR